jgi:hypothetical protein
MNLIDPCFIGVSPVAQGESPVAILARSALERSGSPATGASRSHVGFAGLVFTRSQVRGSAFARTMANEGSQAEIRM